MSADELNLPADPDALRALFADMQARIAVSEQALEAERAAHEATRNAVKLTTLQIEKLKVQLSRLRRMKFGQSSERITEMADQLELTLEDLEAEHAHAACAVGDLPPTEVRPSTARKPKRLPLPDHLPRDETVHLAPDADGCSACGDTMGKLGEDVTEVLEYVSGCFRVVRHVRPKLACGRCDAISQASAPSLPIPRGRSGPNLLAHVVVSKFADHLPLYRQSRIYAREGVDLSRSTRPTGWVRSAGCCSRWLIASPIMSWPAPSSMPTIHPCRFWRRAPARPRRADYGSICATTDDGGRATDRQRCFATAGSQG